MFLSVLRFCGLAGMGVLILGLVHATEASEFKGTWVMRLADRNFLVLRLKASAQGTQGSLDRPAGFNVTNSIVTIASNELRHDRIVNPRFENDTLHFGVQNASKPDDINAFAMRVRGDHATLTLEGLPPGMSLDAWNFERASGDVQAATDWVLNRSYVTGDSDKPNAEMKQLYDADQQARSNAPIDWAVVTKADAARRHRTRTLLAEGALHTGEDYREAAFIFQHGESPDDYLLAHTLAVVAVAKGDAASAWICAATLDRYLQSIGQKQIFGTQYRTGPDRGETMDPYDRDLVPDALRKQLGVPSQSAQRERLKADLNPK